MTDSGVNAIRYGSRSIVFRWVYSDRKTLGITVTPEMDVFVKVPAGTPMHKVEEKILKKAPWIIKQQSFFLSFQPKMPPRKFISGETHLYLGRQYRLKVISDKSLANGEGVKLKGQFLEVYTKSELRVKTLVMKWYQEKANEKIKSLAVDLFDKFIEKHKLSETPFYFSFRKMPTRWGSCTTNGKIILNPELIKAPKGCIEYVIIHELCHLIYHDHSQRFFDLQTKEMHDWEKWKLRLEKLLA